MIPKDIREEVGLHPGTEVDIAVQGGEVVVKAHLARATSLGGRFRHSGMASRLLKDRAAEPE